MKHLPFKLLAICLFAVGSLAGCGVQGNAEASFWVRGNCGMCKERIEGTLNGTKGVTAASYDVDAKMVSVQYDSTLVGLEDLQKACAAVGHETKSHSVAAEVDQALPICCQKGHAM
jgi:periplasmic mercuric ion binding protein